MRVTMQSTLSRIGVACAFPIIAASTTLPAQAAPETIGLVGAMPDIKSVQIDNNHVYDYTFSTAPTDWWVQSGIWEMTNRWACSPGWSWFGGRSQETAAVWNKRHFSGDMSVQFYFAFKMGLTGTPSWLYRPANAAITLCGDGRNLGSGYSFIVGADDNEHSVLMRKGKVVAESSRLEATLPRLTDSNSLSNLNDIHRRWWYVRVNKIGSKVECYLDNNLLFTYNDPKPLDVGQIALWTYNNGIMLSRVQVYYENEQHANYTKLVSKPIGPLTLPEKKATTAIKVTARPVSAQKIGG